MNLTAEHVQYARRQFPALTRQVDGRRIVFFDGPAGTQVPQRVIDAVSDYLAHSNANHGGRFATSHESDQILEEAHAALADLLGADDPETVAFGPNMTTLTFALSRALARTWSPGDEVLVTRLDHDANVSPWVLAAHDAGATIRFAGVRSEDCSLDLDDLRAKLCERTKLVAIGFASNSVGTINPVADVCRWAHELQSLVFVDAVHSAPHILTDVKTIGCDFLACSAYKFFGPHVGVMWGRRELLEQLEAYKVRPAPNRLPGKWMTGTQNHEGIAGARAAVQYLADLGREITADDSLTRRAALESAYQAICQYEQQLVQRLIQRLSTLDSVRVWGITDANRADERLPTVSITHAKYPPAELAERLGQQGIFVWHGNYYAIELSEALGVEPQGMVRIGLVHYNTNDEVERLLAVLQQLD